VMEEGLTICMSVRIVLRPIGGFND
jgi:hypothetical protein